MKTVLSLFAGGGGKTHGAIEAGYSPIGAVDNNRDACAHYRQNIGAIECANLMQIEPSEFDKPDLLMASPPCPNFSLAKVGAREGVIDLALSNRVSYYIRKLKPKAILIENVRQYAGSQSFTELMADIENAGYSYEIGLFNAADFGIPQGRVRLFVRAVRGSKAKILPPVKTHQRKAGGDLPTWRGWYQSIEDLVSQMPKSNLTERQLEAVSGKTQHQMIQRTSYRDGIPKTWADDLPIGTIRASLGTGGNGSKQSSFMDCWLVNGSQLPDPREAERPCFTVRASERQKHRCLVGGDCRSINISALVRLQGWPDGLHWSGDVRSDVRILGNSVCPGVATALINSMVVV
jgi:DNA (cytosine-5)-methyltransferase 1